MRSNAAETRTIPPELLSEDGRSVVLRLESAPVNPEGLTLDEAEARLAATAAKILRGDFE